MLAGELYDPLDGELVAARVRARDLCSRLNATREGEQAERRAILQELLGRGGDTVWMQPPFFCDYGSNIRLGERVFFNFNCVVLDVCAVRIGSYTLFGPGVQLLTPMHPMNARARRGKAADGNHDLRCYNDALSFIADVRDRAALKEKIERAFAQMWTVLGSPVLADELRDRNLIAPAGDVAGGGLFCAGRESAGSTGTGAVDANGRHIHLHDGACS